MVEHLQHFNHVQFAIDCFQVIFDDRIGNAIDGSSRIENINVRCRGARLHRMEVCGLVMRDADKVHAVIRHVECESATRIRLCMAGFFHALGKAQ
jgi:hypothetical protein